MPRYIDADALTKSLELSIKSWSADSNSNAPTMVIAYKDVLYRLKDIPTADVVPKSGVEAFEREVRLLTENTITAKYSHCVIGSYYAVLTKSLEDYEKVIADISSEAKAEVAMEIFEEIERMLREHSDYEICSDGKPLWYYEESLGEDIAELKKKYQEGELNG